MTAAYLETVAICKAFSSDTFKSNSIQLEAIEIGNEADLYSNNHHRGSSYSIQDYVPECVCPRMHIHGDTATDQSDAIDGRRSQVM
jgi:hypothetical protein